MLSGKQQLSEDFTQEGSFQPGCGGNLGVFGLKGRKGTFEVRETAGDASYERDCMLEEQQI